MSAYNWIKVEAECPKCGALATLRCQTHVASDYNGDVRGRFHDREYQLGERMSWWDESDPRYSEWRVQGRDGLEDPESDEEACYATCGSCGGALCAVIRFRQVVPERLLFVTPEENWPKGYSK